MRTPFPLLLAALLLAAGVSCQDADAPEPDCATPATIRDLTGLDGCGFVLELTDGKRLEPHGALWQAYPKHDGERVVISYADDPVFGNCMVGPAVKLKCIRQQNGRCGTVAPGQGN